MAQRRLTTMAALFAVAGATLYGQSTRYPSMAAVDQYLIPSRSAEIALARTAAPPSISARAEILVLTRTGYQVAVPGTNHFVCLVERSWNSPDGAPEFWNPKLRGPDCLNAAAVQSYLPILLLRARLALAGKSEAQIGQAVGAAFDQNKLPAMQPGAMSYMLSKQGYLSDDAGHWHPHLMFFVPLTMSRNWGANLAGSPVLATDDPSDRLTIFMIPVGRWSDGTLDPHGAQ